MCVAFVSNRLFSQEPCFGKLLCSLLVYTLLLACQRTFAITGFISCRCEQLTHWQGQAHTHTPGSQLPPREGGDGEVRGWDLRGSQWSHHIPCTVQGSIAATAHAQRNWKWQHQEKCGQQPPKFTVTPLKLPRNVGCGKKSKILREWKIWPSIPKKRQAL